MRPAPLRRRRSRRRRRPPAGASPRRRRDRAGRASGGSRRRRRGSSWLVPRAISEARATTADKRVPRRRAMDCSFRSTDPWASTTQPHGFRWVKPRGCPKAQFTGRICTCNDPDTLPRARGGHDPRPVLLSQGALRRPIGPARGTRPRPSRITLRRFPPMDVISATVDARGQSCPGPLVSLHKALRNAVRGDLLELLATDPGSGPTSPVGRRYRATSSSTRARTPRASSAT